MSRAARRAAGLATLVLIGSVLAGGGVPLYDGVGFPDEPYRYVHPPSGEPTTPPPSSAHGTVALVHGSNPQGRTFGTDEMGPQVILDLLAQGVRAPADATSVSVALVPVAVTDPPADGTADSDGYDVRLTSGTGPVTVAQDGEGMFVTLRAVSAGPRTPVMAYRPSPSAGWTSLSTRQSGQDTFGAAGPGSGQYLLVQRAESSGRGAQGHGGDRALLLTLGGMLAVVALALVGVRTMSRGAAP